jgi:hypothetical protein
MTSAATRVLLFDVGGVLVQLSGVETMLRWMGEEATSDRMWRMWLQSTPVREFERGRIGADEFAAAVTAELHFSMWWNLSAAHPARCCFWMTTRSMLMLQHSLGCRLYACEESGKRGRR